MGAPTNTTASHHSSHPRSCDVGSATVRGRSSTHIEFTWESAAIARSPIPPCRGTPPRWSAERTRKEPRDGNTALRRPGTNEPRSSPRSPHLKPAESESPSGRSIPADRESKSRRAVVCSSEKERANHAASVLHRLPHGSRLPQVQPHAGLSLPLEGVRGDPLLHLAEPV